MGSLKIENSMDEIERIAKLQGIMRDLIDIECDTGSRDTSQRLNPAIQAIQDEINAIRGT